MGKYEATFWDYYDVEFRELSRFFNTKEEAVEYIDEIYATHSIFKVRLYHNNKEIEL